MTRDPMFSPSPTDRRRMLDLLRAEPGLSTEEIGERAGCRTGWVLSHLRQRGEVFHDAGRWPAIEGG